MLNTDRVAGSRRWPSRKTTRPPRPAPLPTWPYSLHRELISFYHIGISLPLLQVLADKYKSITTQIFDSETDYLDNDSVFAVKDGLTVNFTPRKGDEKAEWELKYDIAMAPLDGKGAGSAPTATSAAA